MQTAVEVQQVHLSGLGVGQAGLFRLVLDGASTPPLAYDVSADDFEAAVEALPAAGGDVDVERTSTTTDVWFVVTFVKS